MTFDFASMTIIQLYALRRQMKSVLDNPNCEGLEEPVNDTIRQIDEELGRRGLGSIIRKPIYITFSLN